MNTSGLVVASDEEADAVWPPPIALRVYLCFIRNQSNQPLHLTRIRLHIRTNVSVQVREENA
jgi:hypothetical protein